MDSILALLLLAGSCVFFLLHRSLLRGIFCLSVAAGCIGALVGNAALWQCLLIFAGSYVLLAVVALARLLCRLGYRQPVLLQASFEDNARSSHRKTPFL